MALPSRQISATSTLDEFLSWCESAGYRVGENPRFGSKTVTKGVHRFDSFHYAGLAADINYGANGPSERVKLLIACTRAQSMGLAVTFAEHGTVGSAAAHRNHLHVDVGEWSNLGRGLIRSSGVNTVGVKFSTRIAQVQATLNKNYPAYSKLVVDGIDGPATQKAVREFQRRSGIEVDGIAGPITLGKLGLR